MSGRPVRVAIASPDRVLIEGLHRMLADQSHRIVVVEQTSGLVDVVLHDSAAEELPESALRRTGAVAWVPLQSGVEQLVALVEAAVTRPQHLDEDRSGLSAREIEVIALIAEGLTNQEIADRVFVSINSVKTYIRSAYRKIGIKNRSQAAVWAMEHGIVRRRH
jgi:NarL family two-component system response regulator LiaR